MTSKKSSPPGQAKTNPKTRYKQPNPAHENRRRDFISCGGYGNTPWGNALADAVFGDDEAFDREIEAELEREQRRCPQKFRRQLPSRKRGG
jgi:hypothetical protein